MPGRCRTQSVRLGDPDKPETSAGPRIGKMVPPRIAGGAMRLPSPVTAPAEQAAGQGAGVLPPIDHDDSVDDHHVDAVGVFVRIVKAGAVGNRLGVKEDEIGGVVRDDRAAIKVKRGGHAAGHLVDRLRSPC